MILDFSSEIDFSLSITSSSIKNILSNFNQPIFDHFLGAPVFSYNYYIFFWFSSDNVFDLFSSSFFFLKIGNNNSHFCINFFFHENIFVSFIECFIRKN